MTRCTEADSVPSAAANEARMPAFYRRSLHEFLEDDGSLIVGRLTSEASRAGFFQQVHAQTDAWGEQIAVLKHVARAVLGTAPGVSFHLLLEYPIPRRGRRIDAVLLAGSVIVVLEFKCGANEYARDSLVQVEDYCLDLYDFHKASRGHPIVPVLVATEAADRPFAAADPDESVKLTRCANRENLARVIGDCVSRYGFGPSPAIDAHAWDTSDYTPTPTIIDAAQSLYAGQNVRDISRCSGGVENLTRTTEAVFRAVEGARTAGRKLACFVTGVPGAGKTLAGLNIVHNRKLHENDLGVFLSGNGPLVKVLTEALARDAADRLSQSRDESRRRVETFLQNVHRFIDAYFAEPAKVPVDKVVVFDEAQRAWDADQSRRKFGRPFSEPETLLEIMDRHPDWAVVVALVGGGQEINRGEAGLPEWGRALSSRFRHWDVLVSPGLKAGTHPTGPCLFPEPPPGLCVTEDESLHLMVNLRSYKAAVLSEFVDAALRLDSEAARGLASRLEDFPLVLTRDLDAARSWLRQHRRGCRRIGLVASSGGRRLRAHGVDVTADLDVENWFLNPAADVRSSHYLEVPATEFGIQGLELDWTGVCWGGDLHPRGGQWVCRAFRGTQWQHVRDESTRRYVVNKYRVLLTRAREGCVIWVPPGDDADPTRPPDVYDRVADHLVNCGVTPLGRASPGNL